MIAKRQFVILLAILILPVFLITSCNLKPRKAYVGFSNSSNERFCVWLDIPMGADKLVKSELRYEEAVMLCTNADKVIRSMRGDDK